MKPNLALSVMLAAAIGFANHNALTALWGQIAVFILQSGFIQWYFKAHFLLPYSVFSRVSDLLLYVFFCFPVAFIALKLFQHRLWLHVAVISAAPILAGSFEFASPQDISASDGLQIFLALAVSLLMVPASVAVLRCAMRRIAPDEKFPESV
jgi:hypothetical protein